MGRADLEAVPAEHTHTDLPTVDSWWWMSKTQVVTSSMVPSHAGAHTALSSLSFCANHPDQRRNNLVHVHSEHHPSKRSTPSAGPRWGSEPHGGTTPSSSLLRLLRPKQEKEKKNKTALF